MLEWDETVLRALKEDLGSGDVTTRITVNPEKRARAELLAKENLVLAGLDVARRAFALVDPETVFISSFTDGDEISKGTVFARVEGRAVSLLEAERVALNFLQCLCGIATLTRRFVAEVAGTKASITDTRKTTPGLRSMEKYAVRVGGGRNHRFSLADGVLIKENHSRAAGGIGEAVRRARAGAPHPLKIEVEVSTLEEVAEAVAAKADILLLDNMDVQRVRESVALVNGRALLEVSGGMALDTVRTFAQTGVDILSVGALTHSARAMDISMLFETGAS
ncbi:MAG: carboxylating nicotinate-nucleotide diphosphorylase [Deltaproteobacteria bacterium]|nr:carboxylating nicotinate-nucleotide diphosphorylase [Deltaproteobacteria bacterium]